MEEGPRVSQPPILVLRFVERFPMHFVPYIEHNVFDTVAEHHPAYYLLLRHSLLPTHKPRAYLLARYLQNSPYSFTSDRSSNYSGDEGSMSKKYYEKPHLAPNRRSL
ncbi:hypothetical protein TNCV_704791 [Trichonephila clavipes]|nr:hypothetical protein TNCV_704791 [Trichonephila clavipes]